MRNLRFLLTMSVLLLSVVGVSAQQSASDAANQLFVEGKYREAIPMYGQLLERYSEDPTYNYRIGVCYFLSDEDLNAAYKYLKVASTKEVPNKVYFYLGEVCRYLYRFDESLSYYKRFMVNGGATDIPTTTLELAAGAASNGQNLLRYSAKVSPVAKALVSTVDFYKTYDTYPISSGFGEIPADLKTSVDRRKDLYSLIFSHVDGGAVGDISVYASYGQGETGSKDLFFIQKLDDGTWSRPQRLPSSINSPFDEDYAYMCSDNRTLYFASKGLYSIGGFDIYRSTYNSDKKEWSTPENMGFPINSPYDDFLFVPSKDGRMACFASTRGVKTSGDLYVFKIDGVDNSLRVDVSSDAAFAMQGLEKDASPTSEKESSVQQTVANPAQSGGVEGVVLLPEYRKLKVALANNEALTDSTVKKIERLRKIWSGLPDSTRRDIERLIVFNENKLVELGGIHEQLVAKATSLEKEYLSGNIKEIVVERPSVSEWFAVNPKLAVYLSAPQLSRLASSPLNLKTAAALVDSLSSVAIQVEDLRQIQHAAVDSLERSKVDGKIDEFDQLLKLKEERLAAIWPAYYDAYFEVMEQMSKSIPQTSNDAGFLKEALTAHLNAKEVRSSASVGANDGKGLVEAYVYEQRSLSLLNLYFANAAGELVLADSLFAALNPSKEADQPEAAVVEKNIKNFGYVKRDDVEIPDIVFSTPTSKGEFSLTPSASYSTQNPMPEIKSLPAGVVYSFQLGLFSQNMNYDLFRFSPMFFEQHPNGKKVFAGIFSSYEGAQGQIKQVKENGFKDAFVVAFIDKKIAPLAKAKALETRKTNTVTVDAASSAMFRVVVGSFSGEMPKNIKDLVDRHLGDKEIVKTILPDGSISFSIGNFNTFESANHIKNKLVSEGLVAAFVAKIELNANGQ